MGFLTLPANTMGPKWTQGSSLIGVNPGVGLRPQNADKKIDSQMFVLRKADINEVPTNEGRPDEGEGELNADYAARMKKFLEVYNEPIGDGYKKFPLSELGECENKPYGFVAISDKKEPNPTIKITPTPQTIGQLIHVECRAYYFGVEHNTKDKMGLVQFEVLIKDE